MKYIKILSLMAVAAAALMAFAGTASATIIEESNGTQLLKGTQIESTGTNAVLKAGFSTVECSHSEVDGKTSNNGGAGETVEGNINNLSFSGCNMTVTVLKKGKLIVHHTSGSNGTVTSEGAEVTVNNHSVSCTYGTTSATNIGNLAGGSPAKLTASASLTRVAGGFLCANPATWTATYTVTTPTSLLVTAG